MSAYAIHFTPHVYIVYRQHAIHALIGTLLDVVGCMSHCTWLQWMLLFVFVVGCCRMLLEVIGGWPHRGMLFDEFAVGCWMPLDVES